MFETMPFLRRIMRSFFHHFYHDFSWTYDFVATVVSIGRWNEWVKVSLRFVQGRRILEIGHGPGHLQSALLNSSGSPGSGASWLIAGLDESRQMGTLAKKRLRKAGVDRPKLARGLAQSLPFPAAVFDSVVSTFPSDYIFDPQTLLDVHRVLTGAGRFIVLPAAWIVGRRLLDRTAAWIFRITGEVPRDIHHVIAQRAVRPLEQAGFQVKVQEVEIRSSIVVVLVATK